MKHDCEMELIHLHKGDLVVGLKVWVGFEWAKETEKKRKSIMSKSLSEEWIPLWRTTEIQGSKEHRPCIGEWGEIVG